LWSSSGRSQQLARFFDSRKASSTASPELFQELRDSILALDSEAIFAAIERIEPLAPDTVKGLQKLMDNFQTGLIRDLLGENDEK